MSRAGYVRLHRSLFGHPAFKNDGEALAFAWLVAKAAWKNTRVRYKGRAMELTRGQVVVSVRDMANALGRERGWVDRFLKRLQAETMIETASVTGVNVITICNYSVYQANDDDTVTVAGQSAGQSRDSERDSSGTLNYEGELGSGVTVGGTAMRRNRDSERDTEQEDKRNKKDIKKEALPDWLPLDAWNGWLEMRRTARKPASARAKQMAIAKLEAMHRKGRDVAASLDQSTLRGWTDLYEPKGASDNKQRLSV